MSDELDEEVPQEDSEGHHFHGKRFLKVLLAWQSPEGIPGKGQSGDMSQNCPELSSLVLSELLTKQDAVSRRLLPACTPIS